MTVDGYPLERDMPARVVVLGDLNAQHALLRRGVLSSLVTLRRVVTVATRAADGPTRL